MPFFHSRDICEEFRSNGLCRLKNCFLRHPKNCRYWTRTEEGCKRNEECVYLHDITKKFNEIDKKIHDKSHKDSESVKPVSRDQCDYPNVNEPDGPSYPCDECDFKTTEKNHLTAHKESLHENPQYPCNQCGFTSERKSAITLHTATVHDQNSKVITKGQYNCDKCKYKAGDITLVEKHIEKVHVESIKMWEGGEESVFYACKECDYNTYDTNNTNLPAHNCDQYSKTL